MQDRHHILHHRQEWSTRPEAHYLRETPELVPRIQRTKHEGLHRSCSEVPLLGVHALQRTVHLFEPVRGDTLGTIDNLLLSIEKASNHPKAHRIERQLAQLSIEAIYNQRLILEGIL